ncbi:ester cyclase [Ruegeria sp. EL01]|uniref:ester cyclase n=1 Tax=Ruegeria sp. EL01 TaxID=2107578 RepID=UPI000EA7F854|nr:ester cyclase [Ruegeria sp. EL01]
MSASHDANRELLTPLRRALYDWDDAAVRRALETHFSPDAVFRCCHPFGDQNSPQAFFENVLTPLRKAWPDAERRDWLVMVGEDEHGSNWVGCGGHYVGTFAGPFLDIPPSGHLAHMRFHEYYRVADGKIVEMQIIWDLPEVMMQVGAWPMAPSLGSEIFIPGPASGDGLSRPARTDTESNASRNVIVDMLNHMKQHPSQGGPEVMEMSRFWHENMNWYGPAGIGTSRGIRGFRNWHQIPFLSGMPDRGQYLDEITYHFFGDGPYVGVTGWPDMVQTVTHDGWMGIAPSGTKITMRSLDFWRVADGRIRENWVLVDLLDAYRQLGVDVFRRLREFNKARVPGRVPFPVGEA